MGKIRKLLENIGFLFIMVIVALAVYSVLEAIDGTDVGSQIQWWIDLFGKTPIKSSTIGAGIIFMVGVLAYFTFLIVRTFRRRKEQEERPKREKEPDIIGEVQKLEQKIRETKARTEKIKGALKETSTEQKKEIQEPRLSVDQLTHRLRKARLKAESEEADWQEDKVREEAKRKIEAANLEKDIIAAHRQKNTNKRSQLLNELSTVNPNEVVNVKRKLGLR